MLALADRLKDNYSAFHDFFPPGSTFKIITAAALMKAGLEPAAQVPCPATYSFPDRRAFTNDGGVDRGLVSFTDAFAYSCNTTFVEQALTRLRREDLRETAAEWGFGRPMPTGAQGACGAIEDPADADWFGSNAIGQGSVVVSPLCMAMIAAAVQDGTLRSPRLLSDEQVRRVDGEPPPPVELDQGVVANLRAMMRAVVDHGTASGAGLPDGVSGKTGTAEVEGETVTWLVRRLPRRPGLLRLRAARRIGQVRGCADRHPFPQWALTYGTVGYMTTITVKPRLRGWLHAGALPVTLIAGFTLVTLGPTLQARLASAIYAITSALLFGISATYHRGTLGPRLAEVLRRLDHANIYLIIAGTYTPFALLALDGAARVAVLAVTWGGALAGVLFRVLWMGAPRWLYTVLYLALGWTADLRDAAAAAGRGAGRRGAGRRRRRLLQRRRRSCTGCAARTRRRAGSATTRSSTPSRSPPTWCSTSRCRSWSTPSDACSWWRRFDRICWQ